MGFAWDNPGAFAIRHGYGGWAGRSFACGGQRGGAGSRETGDRSHGQEPQTGAAATVQITDSRVRGLALQTETGLWLWLRSVAHGYLQTAPFEWARSHV